MRLLLSPLITLQPLQELDEPTPTEATLWAHSDDRNLSESTACAALAARKVLLRRLCFAC
jgi:hypothetical protein